MKYEKVPVSIPNQLIRLEQRGMIVTDRVSAERQLSNISYYRLRAYTYPFQNNRDPEHPFTQPITFNDVVGLYEFDRRLRHLVFNALEEIEISFRTQIIHHWALAHGSHWHLNPLLFRDTKQFVKDRSRLLDEIVRSKERFIQHYQSKYTDPMSPACWMSLEVTSFGLLSKLFFNLISGPEKKAVTQFYGLYKVDILENWMHSFSNLRNICAHHGRLWNRRLTAHIKIPRNAIYPFIEISSDNPFKLYPVLCCIKYTLDRISPSQTFNIKLKELMTQCPLAQEHAMGFPMDWEHDSFWGG
jgi:abortive infection bacteriophage resistance protein